MCQVETDYHDALESADVLSAFKKCVKCKEASAVVVIRAEVTYCRACFKQYFIHKFRAMLGKNRVIYSGEKVLLAVSGGASSCSMLSQVQEGLSQSAHKKLRFIPGIVYIDEGGAIGQSVEKRLRTVAELQAVFKATDFPFYIVPLEQVLDLPNSVVVSSPVPPEQVSSACRAAMDHSSNCVTQNDQEQTPLSEVKQSQTQILQQLMLSAKTLTARQDLLNTLRQHLLVHTARTKGYGKLMLGDSCTRVCVRLLTSISLGRGAQLGQDTGFSDSRYGDVISVRPMRDYSAKEITFYNYLFNVPSLFIPGLDTMVTEKASVQRLTESFVTKLQADFPSTVSTIYRTSEKLQTAAQRCPTAEPCCHRCLLCVCALDTRVENVSASHATLISEQLSQNTSSGAASSKIARTHHPASGKPEASVPTGQCCHSTAVEDCGGAESCGDCCSSAKKPEVIDLRSLLCYSCHLTIKDMTSVEHLPQYIRTEAQRRQRRSQMRVEITEFLLDVSDKDD